ncbi:hypothetical protein Btru_057110 [Bulinus truncatus]|nr:hypothetical protein Btru_057110 [Bulinus truncatus]
MYSKWSFHKYGTRVKAIYRSNAIETAHLTNFPPPHVPDHSIQLLLLTLFWNRMLYLLRFTKVKFTVLCLVVSLVLLWGFVYLSSSARFTSGRQDSDVHMKYALRSHLTSSNVVSPDMSSQLTLTNQVQSDLITSDAEIEKRLQRVNNVCSRNRVSGNVHGVFTHTSGVIYCFVPKAGCTFWKRVFRALNSSIDNPFTISRNLVHTDQGRGVAFTDQHNKERYPVRFLVTRDPFSRLLSTYLDKFYLPDFWFSEARKMIRNRAPNETICETDFLRVHFTKMASRFGNGTQEPHSPNRTHCSKYMTFSEFVRAGLNVSEPHWMPIHQICNPCLFNVTHVLRMETFNQDARLILDRMGMDNVLDNINPVTQVNEDMQTIIDYNFNKTHEPDLEGFFNRCITPRELSYRLWHNFRWRGYIDPDLDYVIPDFTEEEEVKEDLTRQIWRARQSGLAHPERMEREKRYFRERAFQTITRQLFETLIKKYKNDFQLFDYQDCKKFGLYLDDQVAGDQISSTLYSFEKDNVNVDSEDAGELSDNIRSLQGELSDNIRSLQGELSDNIRSLQGELSDDIRSLQGELSDNIRSLQGELRDNIRSLQGELSDNFVHGHGYFQMIGLRSFVD